MTAPPTERGGLRRGVGFALRFAIAAAIVWWLVRDAGWREIVAALGAADPWWLLAAAAAMTSESAAKAWNWGRLLDNLGCATTSRPARLLHVYLVATMAGTVLPSTASTDAMRALLAQRVFGGRPTAHVAAVVINNLLVWIASCSVGLACAAALLLAGRAPSYVPLAILLFTGVVGVGVGLHVALKYYRGFWLVMLRRIFRRRAYFLRRAARRLADALLLFERAHVRFAPRAVVAVWAAASSALVLASCAAAVGVELPVVAWGVIVPLVSLTGLLPISISGLGGAQAVHVLLLVPFGVGVPQAFALSALHALLNLAFNTVFGSVAWLFGPDILERRAIVQASAPELRANRVDERQAAGLRPRK